MTLPPTRSLPLTRSLRRVPSCPQRLDAGNARSRRRPVNRLREPGAASLDLRCPQRRTASQSRDREPDPGQSNRPPRGFGRSRCAGE
jgi:hypothetical protein